MNPIRPPQAGPAGQPAGGRSACRFPISAGFVVAMWMLGLPALSGCAGGRPDAALAPAGPENTTRPRAAYRLAPGDGLDIKFYYSPELNESLVIRPDGYISLQLVGEVQAADLTPGELSDRLREKYARLIPNPEVTAIVRSATPQLVYVGGEVVSPGTCPVQGRLTCAQALFARGGARGSARLSQVLLLRSAGPDSSTVREIDLDRVLDGRDPDVILAPYDVVYVPKTAIARVGQFVQQFINDIVPRSLSFPYALNSRFTVQ
ncbi:MAG: polysaccharide biosynthesis/export family protein [Candidatus Eisenbacteria bacterium]|nr:polysaccharide biosynthesis/export family protein [Candidatus Eisenbacteria bacterium]